MKSHTVNVEEINNTIDNITEKEHVLAGSYGIQGIKELKLKIPGMLFKVYNEKYLAYETCDKIAAIQFYNEIIK